MFAHVVDKKIKFLSSRPASGVKLIPIDASEKPEHDSRYQYLYEKNIDQWRVEEERVVVTYDVITHDFQSFKLKKIEEIRAAAQKAADQYIARYPDFEVASWPTQVEEAKRFIVDHQTETPFCDAASAAREIDKEDFIQRVLSNAEAFSVASGEIAGKRQRLETRINSINPDDVDAVKKIAEITW
ncbi:hypothetical protein JHL22_04925 [Advenella sp. WQ 585]|uniref:Uncharacterized protein n=1 Tax=Advenella mandrilli TaxID=2800330 RepID=A0ABS1EC15_9BURK|nr:hypothetical protein [Advenella mandrilli]MBK1780553.1 hypothetical protein [Advenella mandrilli]